MSKRGSRIDGYFAPRLLEMLRSPAYRVLSRAAHQALACLELELGPHDTKNGKLIVTFAKFVEYGLHPKAIAPAIRELVSLGFLEVVERGRGGNAAWRRPSKYRLTYRKTDGEPPTNEWRLITKEEAAMIAAGARRPAEYFPGSESVLKPGAETDPERSGFSGSESVLHTPHFSGAETDPISRSAFHLLEEGTAHAHECEPPLQWSTPTLTEVTGPVEVAMIGIQCLAKRLAP
jgi:hypothetical protein